MLITPSQDYYNIITKSPSYDNYSWNEESKLSISLLLLEITQKQQEELEMEHKCDLPQQRDTKTPEPHNRWKSCQN